MSKFIPQFEPNIRLKDIWAVVKQMRSGWVGPARTTMDFENALAYLTNSETIVTTSGTVALIMAIKSLELPKSSTILFPAYTFIAGANAARFLGYKIKLVDVSYDTLCMNPNRVEYALKQFKSISCVMFVNHNAYVGDDVEKVQQMCKQYRVKMIEDTSQALGVRSHFKKSPNFDNKYSPELIGDVGIYSFSVPKILTTGQGGAVYTQNENLMTKLRQIRDHGDNWKTTKNHEYLGVNFKLNDILASYGLSQLKDLDKLLEKRKKIFDWYRNHIELIDYGYDSTWMAVYRSQNSRDLIQKLKENDIQAVQHYKPIHWNTPYKAKKGMFKTAEKLFYELVYLPSSLTLTKRQVNKIGKIVKEME